MCRVLGSPSQSLIRCNKKNVTCFFFFIKSKHGFIKKQQGMNFQPNFSRENACLIKSIIVFISQGEFVSHVVMLEDLYVLTSGPCAADWRDPPLQ